MDDLVERLLWHVEQVMGPISTKVCENPGDDDRSVLTHNFDAEIRSLRAQVEQQRAGIVAMVRGMANAQHEKAQSRSFMGRNYHAGYGNGFNRAADASRTLRAEYEQLERLHDGLQDVASTLRAERDAALAEGVAMGIEANRATFQRIKEAADAILAPLCAEVGRWLIEGKDEPDMVKVMHDYGVVIPVRAFAELYDATDDTILAQHKRAKAMDELIATDADLI